VPEVRIKRDITVLPRSLFFFKVIAVLVALNVWTDLLNAKDNERPLKEEYLLFDFLLFRFNAAIPFLVTMIFTLIGMVVGGYVTIRNLSPEERTT